MKKFILLTLLIQLSFLANAQYQVNAVKNGDAYYQNPFLQVIIRIQVF